MPRPEKAPAATGLAAPRFSMAWAALTYLIAAMTLAYPALAGQFLVNPRSDQYIAGYAFREYAAQSLRAGQGIPHWNPFMFGGLPFVAAMHGDIYYPTAFLRVLMPTDAAMTWGFIVHFFLAGFFTFAFLRAWGLSFYAALIGGLAYMMSGPIASYVSPGHDGKLFVSALLPLALWQLVRGVRDGRNWAWGALAITIGLAVLSPHPQLLQYLLLASGAFALYLATARGADGTTLDRRIAVRRLALALVAVVLGLAIGAIQYAPVREYVAWSPRSSGMGWEHAISYSFPIVELVNLYLPQFTGILDKYWGPNGIHLHSEYLGGPMLLLAAAAFGSDARRSFRRFWLGVAIVSGLWMLGGNTPFFTLIYNVVPGTKFFRAPSTMIYVFAFSVSVLAALGTERVLAREINRKLLIGFGAFGALIALLGTIGVLQSMAEPGIRGFAERIAAIQGYPPEAVPQIMAQIAPANRGPLIAGAWRSFFFLAAAVGVILAWQQKRVSPRLVVIALVAIVALDQWSIARLYWLFSAPAKSLYASDPAIDFLKKDTEPGRVAVLGRPDSSIHSPDPYFGTDAMGKGTGLMVHGIRSITGYHGNELGRYQQLSEQRVGQGTPVAVTPMFWRHENVRYLYTNQPLGDSSLKLVVGPVKNSAGSTVYLYRAPGDNPYAWLATAGTKAADSLALPAVLDPRFDPHRIAVFDTGATTLPPPPTSLPEPTTIAASATNVTPGRATITLGQPAPANSVLIVSENYFPGWKATVDGQSRPAYRADYNLIGVPLQAGAKKIELTFRDAALETGKSITLLAVALALIGLGAGVVADRRRVA